MEDTTIIGVDLGGTNMRAGLVKGGEILKKSANAVPKTEDAQVVVNQLIKTIKEVLNNDVKGIGVGVPGLVKVSEGMIYKLNNIPSWKKVPLKVILEREFNLPVYINNDANCYAVGERYFGEGKRFKDFVGLITGTGVGGGIINKGHLLSDQNCGAGEFGMIPYLDHTYEFYCSGQFFQNLYKIDGGELAAKAIQGDKHAQKVFSEYGTHLGKLMKVILLTLEPEAIVIGGSVSKSFKLYQQSMWEEVKTHPFTVSLESLKIVPSNINDIAILGAAALYLDMML